MPASMIGAAACQPAKHLAEEVQGGLDAIQSPQALRHQAGGSALGGQLAHCRLQICLFQHSSLRKGGDQLVSDELMQIRRPSLQLAHLVCAQGRDRRLQEPGIGAAHRRGVLARQGQHSFLRPRPEIISEPRASSCGT